MNCHMTLWGLCTRTGACFTMGLNGLIKEDRQLGTAVKPLGVHSFSSTVRLVLA